MNNYYSSNIVLIFFPPKRFRRFKKRGTTKQVNAALKFQKRVMGSLGVLKTFGLLKNAFVRDVL